jgi:hypothetical protein
VAIRFTTVQTVEIGSGGVLWSNQNSGGVLSLERILEPMAIPEICGNGHLLTPDNLKVDGATRRWRCRRCGRVRAAEFRARHKPAA